MKKIKLEVVVADKDAEETLTFFQKIVINDASFYVLCMENCDA